MCALRSLASLVVLLVAVRVGVVHSEEVSATQDAFCGSTAARACVEHLGVRWRESPEVLHLEAQPICTFREIQDAIVSLGLQAVHYRANRKNLPELTALLNRKSSPVAAVVWDRGHSSNWIRSGDGIGHFLAVTGIDEGKLVCFDQEDRRVHLRELADNQWTYLLLVSGSPIEPQRRQLGEILFTSFRSGVAAPFILLACFTVAFSFSKRSIKTGSLASHGTRLASAFRMSRGMAMLLSLTIVGLGSYAVFQGSSISIPLTRSSFDSANDPAKSRVFEGAEISLGSIIIGSGEKYQVRLTNQTSQILRIDDVIPSCGCVLVEPRQFVLQPSEAKLIDIQITAANLGRNTHELVVMSNKSTLDRAVLAFDGVNGPRLLPRTCVVGVLSAKEKNQLEHQLTLENIDAGRWVVTDAELVETDAPIEILLSPSQSAGEDGQLTIGLVLKENVAFRGLFFSNIRLNVNDENSGRSVPSTPMLAQIGVEIVD